ncbi:pre-mRNA-splicing factor cwc21 [Aspergillus terreus]|uniref:Pre-mRNA-splicing factor cwc21 n=1 Tax=Aspergillus terreus TaxID=33178 RepID=A0A5M3Z2E7_ASPTE|nr:hypothetical protein ATETN484_0008017300 [Aspergillus terreus]GFF21074.1 pre-mRNA-splicing factor cwc21 [Aspergillus terreus]
MSSNVGLSTPRGSGTSGYVQRNTAFMKPRNTGYGAPYPPVSGANGDGRAFKQRQPDKQILEHDRRRAVEVKVMEERERLEEANERLEEERAKGKGKGKTDAGAEEGEAEEGDGERVLSEEEIEERCAALRERLLKEMEEEGDGGGKAKAKAAAGRQQPRERRQFKAYQVHELAEAKIEESERLRRALGIREDRETGEISGERRERRRREE